MIGSASRNCSITIFLSRMWIKIRRRSCLNDYLLCGLYLLDIHPSSSSSYSTSDLGFISCIRNDWSKFDYLQQIYSLIRVWERCGEIWSVHRGSVLMLWVNLKNGR